MGNIKLHDLLKFVDKKRTVPAGSKGLGGCHRCIPPRYLRQQAQKQKVEGILPLSIIAA
ncbi:hypothetical protein [Paenibacillus sp. 1011MAR3C5]|uniref:hypothetical protein n=1 Tax=Paenibacillus sp. 1011MAR3C5 TaxID=1675787 RepID=UPI0016048AC6|nr:hypothetical protein [Paenibacillus sp. 1011MAR3C5]